MSSSFRPFHIKKIFEFGKVGGFFFERRLDIFDFLDRRCSLLNLFDPFLNMVMVLIDLILNIVKILDNEFALFCHFFDALDDG